MKVNEPEAGSKSLFSVGVPLYGIEKYGPVQGHGHSLVKRGGNAHADSC